LGVRLRITFSDSLALLVGEFNFVGGVTQHHQTTHNRADCNDQNQPGIPGHRALLEGRPADGFRQPIVHTTLSDSISQWFHSMPDLPATPAAIQSPVSIASAGASARSCAVSMKYTKPAAMKPRKINPIRVLNQAIATRH